MRRIWCVIIVLATLLTVVSSGCNGVSRQEAHREVLKRMDVADSLMEINPDTALVLLQGIDSVGLTDRPTMARYSLLMGRAIELTSDLTDIEVLRPALEYYSEHGTPTEKLRTYHLAGCVYTNAGKAVKALEYYRLASAEGRLSADTLSRARALIGEGTIYFRFKKWDDYLRVNMEGAELFRQIADSARYYNALLRVATAYSRQGKWNQQMVYLRKIKKEYTSMPESLRKGYYYPEVFLNYQETGNKDSLEATVNEYMRTVSHLTAKDSLDFVGAYAVLGLTGKAREYLPAESADTSYYYHRRWAGMVAYLLEVEGDLKSAAAYQRQYETMGDSVVEGYLSQSVGLLNEKQTVDEKSHDGDRRLRHSALWIILLVLATVIIGVLCIVFLRRSRFYRHENRTMQHRHHRVLADMLEQLDVLNAQLEEEKAQVRNLKDRSHHRMSSLMPYLNKFNKILMACHLNDGYYQDIASDTVSKIIESKESLLSHAEQLYSIKYPSNVGILKEYGLNTQELQICYLTDLGMQSKHIAKFLNIGNIYNKTREIRDKLGITNSRVNLKTWLSRNLAAPSGPGEAPQ